jgi:hypothetical protein
LQPPHTPAQVPWPTQGYADQPTQAGPAYHFPPPDPDPNYGYNQPAYAPQQWAPPDQQRYDLTSYLPADGAPPFQHTAHQQPYADQDPGYDDEYYDDEEPRRGRRWMFIAAALIGAIGVGGALAYTYRSFVAPSSVRVPVVRADPNKAAERKEAAPKERKLPHRTETAAAAPPPAPAEAAADSGPRKVVTIPVGPQQAPKRPMLSSIPGIMLDNGGPPPATEEQPPAASPPAAQPPADETPPAREETIAERTPPPPPPPPVEKEEATPSAAQKREVVASIQPPPRRDPPRQSRTGAIVYYVAVVSSQRTYMDALKAYADVADKNPDVLGNKKPDVVEVDLGEKGVRFRAVVGPPGSRDSAARLCGQLKAAGSDCWVAEFKGT